MEDSPSGSRSQKQVPLLHPGAGGIFPAAQGTAGHPARKDQHAQQCRGHHLPVLLPPSQQQDPLQGIDQAETVLIRQVHVDKLPEAGDFPDNSKSKNH